MKLTILIFIIFSNYIFACGNVDIKETDVIECNIKPCCKLLEVEVKFLSEKTNRQISNQVKNHKVQIDSLNKQYASILDSQQNKFDTELANQQLKFESELSNQRWIFALISAGIGLLLWLFSFLGFEKIKKTITEEVEVYIKDNHVEQTEKIVNDIAVSEVFVAKVKALIDVESMNGNDTASTPEVME